MENKKTHSTARYLENILVCIFCALLCFLVALWWRKKKAQATSRYLVFYFVYFVRFFGISLVGKKCIQRRDILKISPGSSFYALLCFLGLLW